MDLVEYFIEGEWDNNTISSYQIKVYVYFSYSHNKIQRNPTHFLLVTALENRFDTRVNLPGNYVDIYQSCLFSNFFKNELMPK